VGAFFAAIVEGVRFGGKHTNLFAYSFNLLNIAIFSFWQQPSGNTGNDKK